MGDADLIVGFCAITQANENEARYFLTKRKFDLNEAISEFYNHKEQQQQTSTKLPLTNFNLMSENNNDDDDDYDSPGEYKSNYSDPDFFRVKISSSTTTTTTHHHHHSTKRISVGDGSRPTSRFEGSIPLDRMFLSSSSNHSRNSSDTPSLPEFQAAVSDSVAQYQRTYPDSSKANVVVAPSPKHPRKRLTWVAGGNLPFNKKSNDMLGGSKSCHSTISYETNNNSPITRRNNNSLLLKMEADNIQAKCRQQGSSTIISRPPVTTNSNRNTTTTCTRRNTALLAEMESDIEAKSRATGNGSNHHHPRSSSNHNTMSRNSNTTTTTQTGTTTTRSKLDPLKFQQKLWEQAQRQNSQQALGHF